MVGYGQKWLSPNLEKWPKIRQNDFFSKFQTDVHPLTNIHNNDARNENDEINSYWAMVGYGQKWLSGQFFYFYFIFRKPQKKCIITVEYTIMLPEMKMIRLTVIELWRDTDRNGYVQILENDLKSDKMIFFKMIWLAVIELWWDTERND